MNPLENYAALLNEIFGSNSATFSTSSRATNNVIGALNHPSDFEQFRRNFPERLRRLRSYYKNKPNMLKYIIKVANEVAFSNNWDGAFAELTALDHFNFSLLGRMGNLAQPVATDVTLSPELTYAAELRKSKANLDGYVEEAGLYYDVKTLKDNVDELLNNIFKQVSVKLNQPLRIEAEYDLHIGYSEIREKFDLLIIELISRINIQQKTKHIRSEVIDGLTFKLVWETGVTFLEHGYDPYEHAKNFHLGIFQYADKFVKASKSMIVLVHFPWFNQVINDFNDSNKKFYRATARRVFCQYKNNSTLFSSFNSKFKGSQNVAEVSQHLSGIIFLEDDSIMSVNAHKPNVVSFVYYNPNSLNPVPGTFARDFIHGLSNNEIDDFENDNY
jgi:hypothetical protein